MTTASTSSDASPQALPHGFATTHWSVVLSAHAADTPTASAALNQLCRDYWYPLYAYIRRQGVRAEDAEHHGFAREPGDRHRKVADAEEAAVREEAGDEDFAGRRVQSQ